MLLNECPLFIQGGNILAFKVYDKKDSVDVSKEYTAEEIYAELPTYSKGDKVLVIDGDIIAFRCSSVCETKYQFENEQGDVYNVKSKTAFKEYCFENGLDYDSFTDTPKQIADPISYCIKTLNDSIKKVMDFVGATHYEIYIGGSNNFRLSVPTPIEYKSSRSTSASVRPLLLTPVKEYLIKYKGAKRVKGEEADDVVQCRMRNLNKNKVRCIAYSIDKDIFQNVDYDLMVYDPSKEDIIVSKKGVGELWETKYGVKGSGLKWLITQTLLGDPVDSYTPKQFFNKRYADKSLYKDFNGCKTEVEVLEKFVEVVKRLVPQNVSYTSFNGQLMELNRKELFEMYYTMCKMRDDWCHTLEELFSFYNLDVNSLIYEEA